MISDIGLRDRIRAGFSFLPQASSGFQEDFFRCSSYSRLEKGQFVCHEGTQRSHLALVLTGSARVYKLGESGREITLYRVEPGQSFNLTASCILSDLPFPAFAVTETAAEAAIVAPGEISGDCGETLVLDPNVRFLFAQECGTLNAGPEC